eukprot:2351063-Amphidinium_carterae.1
MLRWSHEEQQHVVLDSSFQIKFLFASFAYTATFSYAGIASGVASQGAITLRCQEEMSDQARTRSVV